MSREHIKLNKIIKSFTRLGKRNPEDLVASDWSLVASGGYSDSYALIYSEELHLTLSYGTNSYPLTDFMNKDVFAGRLELCQKEKKDLITIKGSSDLVFTQNGLIPSIEYYEALNDVNEFKESGKLFPIDLEENKIYIDIEGKIFIYRGYETMANGELSSSPKIQEIILVHAWRASFRSKDLILKNRKGLGKTSLSHEITLEDFDYFHWNEGVFKNFVSIVKQRAGI